MPPIFDFTATQFFEAWLGYIIVGLIINTGMSLWGCWLALPDGGLETPEQLEEAFANIVAVVVADSSSTDRGVVGGRPRNIPPALRVFIGLLGFVFRTAVTWPATTKSLLKWAQQLEARND